MSPGIWHLRRFAFWLWHTLTFGEGAIPLLPIRGRLPVSSAAQGEALSMSPGAWWRMAVLFIREMC